MRGWCGEIAEWGAAPRPAHFVLTAGDHNSLFAELTNITRLCLRLAESPFDRTQPLQVAVNGAVPITLPGTVVLARGEKGWGFESKTEPAPWRLHTPGSALLLYEGDPLLIIYGTQGSDAERKAMQAAAEAASKNANPAWLDDNGDKGTDGVPHSQNLYGRLNTKADTAVTDADIGRCHLVLIDTATQNAVVARIASRLSVQIGGGVITCNDGVQFPDAHRALGLVHYNPLAPERLVFWVASDNPATYAANSVIPLVMSGGITNGGTCGADLGMAGVYVPPTEAPIVPGITRVSDVMPLFYFSPVGVAEMSGAELAEAARRFTAVGGSSLMFCKTSEIKASELKPDSIYRVAFPTDLIWRFSAVAKMAPRSYRHTDLGAAEALERFLAAE
jgi:hypothetical protein